MARSHDWTTGVAGAGVDVRLELERRARVVCWIGLQTGTTYGAGSGQTGSTYNTIQLVDYCVMQPESKEARKDGNEEGREQRGQGLDRLE